MIRAAKAMDVPQLAALLRAAFARSKYVGLGSIDVNYAKSFLLQMIMGHQQPGEEGTCCMVWEENGEVRGLHFAMRQRVYLVGDKFQASDVFFYLEPGSSPFAWAALLSRFLRWAKSDPAVIEITPGCTDIIPGVPWKRIAAMYQRAGFKQTGAIFAREIERKAS